MALLLLGRIELLRLEYAVWLWLGMSWSDTFHFLADAIGKDGDLTGRISRLKHNLKYGKKRTIRPRYSRWER